MRRPQENALMFVVWIVACEAIGFLGSWWTLSEIPTWYASLNTPWFQPPNWLFGPVWTLLYALIGVAGLRIWSSRIPHAETKKLFLGQVVLNGIWTPVFFGAHNMIGALVIILTLDVVVFFLIRRLWTEDRIAATLLFPYLLWILFATILNAAILHLNP